MKNADRLSEAAKQVLSEGYEAEGSLLERLDVISGVVEPLVEIDSKFTEISEQMELASIHLQETVQLCRQRDNVHYSR